GHQQRAAGEHRQAGRQHDEVPPDAAHSRRPSYACGFALEEQPGRLRIGNKALIVPPSRSCSATVSSQAVTASGLAVLWIACSEGGFTDDWLGGAGLVLGALLGLGQG